jgi:TnpA family transposase
MVLATRPKVIRALATRSGVEALPTRLRRLAVTCTSSPADQYVFATRAISCPPREALYVPDGLLENDTIFHPHEHSTDTHGFTE